MKSSIENLISIGKDSTIDAVSGKSKIGKAKCYIKIANSKNTVQPFLTKSKKKNMI